MFASPVRLTCFGLCADSYIIPPLQDQRSRRDAVNAVVARIGRAPRSRDEYHIRPCRQHPRQTVIVWMRKTLRRRPAYVLLALAGCQRLAEPALPADAYSFSPPVVYATWWKLAQACAGLPPTNRPIPWYAVP